MRNKRSSVRLPLTCRPPTEREHTDTRPPRRALPAPCPPALACEKLTRPTVPPLAQLTESLRAVFADLDAARDASSRAEAAVELGLSPEAVVERKLSPSAELRELLSSAWMRKRLRAEYAVVVRSDRAAKAVRVFGEPEGVEAAGAFVAGMGPVGVARIKVDEENLSLLIGRKGATVEALQAPTPPPPHPTPTPTTALRAVSAQRPARPRWCAGGERLLGGAAAQGAHRGARGARGGCGGARGPH